MLQVATRSYLVDLVALLKLSKPRISDEVCQNDTGKANVPLPMEKEYVGPQAWPHTPAERHRHFVRSSRGPETAGDIRPRSAAHVVRFGSNVANGVMDGHDISGSLVIVLNMKDMDDQINHGFWMFLGCPIKEQLRRNFRSAGPNQGQNTHTPTSPPSALPRSSSSNSLMPAVASPRGVEAGRSELTAWKPDQAVGRLSGEAAGRALLGDSDHVNKSLAVIFSSCAEGEF